MDEQVLEMDVIQGSDIILIRDDKFISEFFNVKEMTVGNNISANISYENKLEEDTEDQTLNTGNKQQENSEMEENTENQDKQDYIVAGEVGALDDNIIFPLEDITEAQNIEQPQQHNPEQNNK